MRHVYEHAETVHGLHDLTTERRQATRSGVIDTPGRSSPVIAVDPRQREIPRAATMELGELLQRVLDRVATFNRREYRDLVCSLRLAHIIRRLREYQMTRMPRDERVNDIESSDRTSERFVGIQP